MSIIKTTQPYEFLIRWNQDGTVSGQHIQYREIVKDTETGEVYSDRPGNALPVTEGGDYPLNDVLSEIQVLQATEIEAKQQTITSAQEALGVMTNDRDNKQAERDVKSVECVEHLNEIASLQAQVEALTPTD